MKTLKFKSYLVDQILNGSKTITWRLFDDKDLKEGDVFEIIDASTGENKGKAVITEIEENKIKNITKEQFHGHGYKNSDAMIANFKNYYGDKVNLDTMVKVVKFKLIND